MTGRNSSDDRHEGHGGAGAVPAGSASRGRQPAPREETGTSARPPSETAAESQIPARNLVLAVAGLTLVVVAFFSSYASALGNPSPRHVPVAVAAPPAVLRALKASPPLRVYPVTGAMAARTMVEHRSADGALVVPRTGLVTAVVADGGGHAVAAVVTQAGQQVAHARGTAVRTVDVARTSPADPNGSVEFYAVAFLVIGSMLGATVLGRILGPVHDLTGALRRLGVVVLYTALLSLAVTVFADLVFGALVGHFALLFLILWLFAVALCLTITGIAALAGSAASIVVVLLLIMFGNPSSGGAVPRPLLNSFYSGLSPVLPQGAVLSGLRGIQYFTGHGTGPAVLCLAIWVAAGLVLLSAHVLRNARAGSHDRAVNTAGRPAQP